jgi:hypothetical protein
MKNLYKYILPALCICLTLSSCKPKLKRCSGIITYIQKDTIKMKIGDKDAVFLTAGANFERGIVVASDSAEVTYLGSFSNGKAVLIRLIPPKSHIIDVKTDTTKQLITTPASPAKLKKFKEFIKKEKERLHQK